MEQSNNNELTNDDKQQVREYIEALDELYKREPKHLASEIWDEAMPRIKAAGGTIPAEYADVIGVRDAVIKSEIDKNGHHVTLPEGKSVKTYYEIEWESWNSERAAIEMKYHDAINKALRISLKNNNDDTNASIAALLQQIIDEKKTLPAVVIEKLKKTDFPIDKVNKDMWHALQYADEGQITFARYNVARKNSKEEIYINFSIDFNKLDGVRITRKLEPYDMRVYLATAALYNHGYEVISTQQIYTTMGLRGRAGAHDLEKINDSITKMSGAHLYIDNQAEASKYRYKHFKYDSSLLPMERVTAIINGQVAETAIRLFREPPMVTFARDRKQITTVPIKLLETPLSKTNQNLALEDYLLEQIAHMKRGSVSNKMLYQTIYENAGITTAKQKTRAPEKIKKILEYYVKCKHIKSYDMKTDKDGVIIMF